MHAEMTRTPLAWSKNSIRVASAANIQIKEDGRAFVGPSFFLEMGFLFGPRCAFCVPGINQRDHIDKEFTNTRLLRGPCGCARCKLFED